MEQNNYKLIRESFFNSYKSFVDYIMLSNAQNKLYNILILRKRDNDNLTRVNIIIRSSHNNNDNNYHELSSTMVLNNDEAGILINDIREDFRDNHYIAYSAVNPKTLIQTLQNTKFSLNIKLVSEKEFEEAINFNNKINIKSNRNKVLTRSLT